MVLREVITPIIINDLETSEQDIKEFIVEIRKQGDSQSISKIAQAKWGIKSWIMAEAILFDHTIKGTVYEFRTATRDIHGNLSTYSDWKIETAGDTSFGSTSWTNSLTATSHSIIVAVNLTNKPFDFDRIEIYVKSSGSLTDPNVTWRPDHTLDTEIGEYYWAAQREVTKYFYSRAFDQSGNYSSLVEIGSSAIKRIDWDADLDDTPPDNSTLSGALETA